MPDDCGNLHRIDGWPLFPPQGTDLDEAWAEFHSKYDFVNGTFTAERRLVFKKEKVPLADWDKYVRFREAIYADSARTASIGVPPIMPLTDRP
ncbi:MAG TPA: hypothetical protein VFE01_00805, partial [Terracidiphilus sp.]|nr:hypothetical protein [Terracidiphilus sp.]